MSELITRRWWLTRPRCCARWRSKREVQARDGAWYLVRMLPYRTMENLIDGLVVTFVDITKVRGLQQQTEAAPGALTSSPTTVFSPEFELSLRVGARFAVR